MRRKIRRTRRLSVDQPGAAPFATRLQVVLAGAYDRMQRFLKKGPIEANDGVFFAELSHAFGHFVKVGVPIESIVDLDRNPKRVRKRRERFSTMQRGTTS